MADRITVGSVAVSVVPDARTFPEKLKAQLRDIDDVRVPVKADTAEAEGKIAELRSQVGSGLSGDARKASDSFENLSATALAFGPALIPTLAVAGAGTVALGAGLAAATGGLASLAVLAAPTLRSIGTSAGPATTALAGLKSEFAGLSEELRPQVIGLATTALQDAGGALRLVGPVASAAAGGLRDVLASADSLGPRVTSLAGAFAGFTHEAVADTGTALVNLGVGVGEVAAAFIPLAQEVLPKIDDSLEHFAASAGHLGQSSGFQSFLSYVEANGPRVAAVVGELAVDAEHLISGLAPLGTGALIGLEGLAGAVEHIPVPVITATAVAVGSLVAAAKGASAFSSLSTAIGNLGKEGGALASLGAAAGPVGVAAVGIGLVAASLLSASAHAKEAQAAAQAYLQTLATFDPSKYATFTALNVSIDAQRTKLQALAATYTAYNAASNAGILGVTQATALQDQLVTMTGLSADKAVDAGRAAQGSLDKLNASAGQTADTVAALASAYHLSQDGVLALAAANSIDLTGGLGQAKTAFSALAGASESANSQSGQLTAAQQTLASSFSTSADKANALQSALAALSGDAISAATAQDDFTIALAKLPSQLDSSSHSLAGNTVAAATNQKALLGLFQQAESIAVAQEKVDGNTAGATAQYQRNYTALLAAAQAAGLNASQVQALVTKYHLLPSDVKTAVTANTTQATTAIAAVQQQLNGLTDKQITIALQYESAGLTPAGAAALSQNRTVRDPGAISKATGGLITGAGTGTSDSIAAHLSNGEFVVNAAATSRNLALLQSINGSARTYANPAAATLTNVGPIGGDDRTLAALNSIRQQLAALTNVSAASPGRTGSAVAAGLNGTASRASQLARAHAR